MSRCPGRRRAERVRGVPARSAAALLDRLARDGNRRADGRHDAAFARRRARLPLLVPLDLRRGVCRAGEVLRPDPEGRPVRRRGPRRLCRHDRRRSGLADGGRAARRPRGDHRLRRGRSLRADGCRRRRRRARDRGRRRAGQARDRRELRRLGRSALGRHGRGHRRGDQGRHRVEESTMRSRRRAGPRR